MNINSVTATKSIQKAHMDRLLNNCREIASGTVTLIGTKTFSSASFSPLSNTYSAFPKHIAILREELPNNTAPYNYSSLDGWKKRALNTESYNNIPGCSLSSNQITLLAGKYFCKWAANVTPALSNYSLKSRLRDVTNNITLLFGTIVRVYVTTGGILGNSASDKSYGIGYFTLAGTVTLELQCKSSNCYFGHTCNFGENELYCELFIERIS